MTTGGPDTNGVGGAGECSGRHVWFRRGEKLDAEKTDNNPSLAAGSWNIVLFVDDGNMS